MSSPLVIFWCQLFVAVTTQANSEVWTFRSMFSYNPWNEAILPYRATIPTGQRVRSENIRAFVSPPELVKMRAEAAQTPEKRWVRRQVVDTLRTADDVERARTYLLPAGDGIAVDIFQTAAGYIDRFGLLAIMQLTAKWQCAADEHCPQRISGKLDSLLATGGRIMKTETFLDIAGAPWIIATITYEVSVGREIRVIPLQSRKLEVREGH